MSYIGKGSSNQDLGVDLNGNSVFQDQWVVLTSDVVNNNAVADTLQDVTGLSFPVVNGGTYAFRFYAVYDSAATTTGSRWTVNGPAIGFLAYSTLYTLTAASNTQGFTTNWNTATVNATSLLTGNRAVVEGVYTAAADGTVILRFASEVASSAITAKSGSYVFYKRLI